MKTPAATAVLLGLIGFSLVAPGQTTKATTPPQYQVCQGYFALCTTATCGQKPSGSAPATYSCTQCSVLNGSSVASLQPPCVMAGAKPAAGQTVQSRFAMTTNLQLVTCTNTTSWANCLNATCTVDTNTNYATCSCPSQATTPYVWGTANAKSQAGCTGNLVISSESTTDADQIGAFWTSHHLTPFTPPLPPARK